MAEQLYQVVTHQDNVLTEAHAQPLNADSQLQSTLLLVSGQVYAPVLKVQFERLGDQHSFWRPARCCVLCSLQKFRDLQEPLDDHAEVPVGIATRQCHMQT